MWNNYCDATAAFKKKPSMFPLKDFFEDKTGTNKLDQWQGTDKCFHAIAKQQDNAIGAMVEQLMQSDAPETQVKSNKLTRD